MFGLVSRGYCEGFDVCEECRLSNMGYPKCIGGVSPLINRQSLPPILNDVPPPNIKYSGPARTII